MLECITIHLYSSLQITGKSRCCYVLLSCVVVTIIVVIIVVVMCCCHCHCCYCYYHHYPITPTNSPDLSQGVRGGSAGLLRCGKASTWEGGLRVPAIAWWPYKIRHGRTHHLAATLDLLPTIYSIVDAELPEDVRLDGVDLSSVLFNKAGKVGVVIC